MNSQNFLLRFARARDWRISVGIVVSVVWISGALWFTALIHKTEPIQLLSLESVGSFLEGAFAPLAFLWLVLGLFMQQKELANNTEVLQRTSLQSEIQTQAIAATEMNARQGTFFKIAEAVRRQLGAIVGLLFVSSMGPPGNGKYNREQMAELWHQSASGDNEVFTRLFLTLDAKEEGGYHELFYGTEIRRRHTANFCTTYERLMRLARNCDVDTIIENSFSHTGLGLLYRLIQQNDDAAVTADSAEAQPDP